MYVCVYVYVYIYIYIYILYVYLRNIIFNKIDKDENIGNILTMEG